MTRSPVVDLAIVGASFAGLATARVAASRGLRTRVIDRKPEPGARVHTTGLLVKEAAEEWTVPNHLTRRIHGVRLYSPRGRTLDLQRPGYYFLATDTAGLLRWLAADARGMGADVRYATPFDRAEPIAGLRVRRDDPRVQLWTGANGGSGDSLRARYLVGADGPKSKVARAFGLSTNRHFLIGVEAEYEGVRGVDPDFLHVFLDSRLAPGYIAWLVPGVNGITQIGLARRHPGKAQLDEFIALLSRRFDFSAATRLSTRGGLIPVGGRLPRIGMAGDGVMLAGDAAGLVSPLTAGGIHTAVRYGRAAAHAIGDYLQCNGIDPLRAMDPVLPSFRVKRAMRRLLDLRPPGMLYDAMLGLPPFRAIARLVFFHNRGLFSWQAWRDLLRGVPTPPMKVLT